jgi:hypothetical protein
VYQAHVPIVHTSTWTFEGKTSILTRAMQACGAQFVKTRAARDFVSQTLHSTCESLLQAVRFKLTRFAGLFSYPHQAKGPIESEEMMDMILAGLLIQAINLFRQTIDQRPAAGHFHGMLVMASNCSPSTQNEFLNYVL